MAKWASICWQCDQPFAKNGSCGCAHKPVDARYASLRRVLDLAYDQAAVGKGAERHADGKPFDCQPMMEIGRMVGIGFTLGQAMKKAQEASRMDNDAAKRELLGAINYLAGAYLLLEENAAN